MTYSVPRQNVDDFRTHGFTVLRGVIDADMLALLRSECDTFVSHTDERMKAQNLDVQGINHRGKRYFISNRYRDGQELWRFLFGSLMQSITTAFLGDNVFLFLEQWVVKGPHQGMKFAWHQDSGYVNHHDPGNRHEPYITCWCALDDVSHTNGTISVLPHAIANTKDRVLDHVRETGTNDLVGYTGAEAGVEITAPAGTIAVFSSTSLHRSSANLTDRWRRAYLAQYSAQPVTRTNGSLWSMAVPFVEHGQLIYDVEKDLAAGNPWTHRKDLQVE